jgi:hypothetical protein
MDRYFALCWEEITRLRLWISAGPCPAGTSKNPKKYLHGYCPSKRSGIHSLPGRLTNIQQKACIGLHLRLSLTLATYLGVLSACALASSLSCLPDNPHYQMMKRTMEGLVPFVRSVGRLLVRNHDHYPTCPAPSPGSRPVHEDGSSSTGRQISRSIQIHAIVLLT